MTEKERVIKLDDEIFAKILNPLIINETSKTTFIDANFINLLVFTTLPTLPTAPISTTITSTIIKNYKFNAYITNSSSISSEDLNLINSSSATDMFSTFDTTDIVRSFERNTNSVTSPTPQVLIFNNLTTINLQLTE